MARGISLVLWLGGYLWDYGKGDISGIMARGISVGLFAYARISGSRYIEELHTIPPTGIMYSICCKTCRQFFDTKPPVENH